MSKKTVWTIVSLIGLYVMCQAIADVAATKMVQIGTLVFPGGTFIFTITFTVRDMLHKRLGREWARAAISVAAALNVLLAVYLIFIANLPAPPFFKLNDSWSVIFSFVPAITIASILAEFVSEMLDTEVYHIWSKRFPIFPQWSRVLVSNAVSLPVDSLIFSLLAFVLLPPVFGAESLPIVAALSLGFGQIIFKAVVTIISLPLIYTVPESPLNLST